MECKKIITGKFNSNNWDIFNEAFLLRLMFLTETLFYIVQIFLSEQLNIKISSCKSHFFERTVLMGTYEKLHRKTYVFPWKRAGKKNTNFLEVLIYFHGMFWNENTTKHHVLFLAYKSTHFPSKFIQCNRFHSNIFMSLLITLA